MIRRWRNLLAPRPRVFKFPPLPPATAGPLIVRRENQAATSRRGLPPQRGRFFKFPPLPPATSGPLVVRRENPGATSRRGLPVRRGRFLPVAPPPVAATATPVPAFGFRRARPAGPVRRDTLFFPPPLPVTAPPPAMARRTRTVTPPAHHGGFQPVVPPQIGPGLGPLVAAFRVTTRPRGAAFRRGEFLPVPLAAAPPPTFTPRRARPISVVRREGQFFPPPLPMAGPPAGVARRGRVAALPTRRGHFQPAIPQPQTAAGPGPLVLATVRGSTRRTVPPARRGVFARIPLVGVLPGTGPLPPQLRGRAARFALPTRHGRFLPFTPAQVVAAAPPFVARLTRPRTPLLAPPRHGAFQPVIPDTLGPRVLVRATCTARPGLARRGRFLSVPPVRPAGPGPLPPALHRRDRARYLPLIRGRFQQPYLLGAEAAPSASPVHAGTPTDLSTRYHAGTTTDVTSRDRAGTPSDTATRYRAGAPT